MKLYPQPLYQYHIQRIQLSPNYFSFTVTVRDAKQQNLLVGRRLIKLIYLPNS